jgi:23S rRNA (uracil1939-C5)-methyltransferase
MSLGRWFRLSPTLLGRRTLSAVSTRQDPPDQVELVAEHLVAGGDALGRPTGDGVVFARGALPGERVQVSITERHRGWSRGPVDVVVDASPDRVDPPCPSVADGCGGCDLQHAAVAIQPSLKVSIVVDALRRLGGIADPVVVGGRPLPAEGFRTTVRVGVLDGRAGFRRHHSHDVVVPDDCLIAHPRLAELMSDGRFPGASEVVLRVGATTGERLAVVDPTATDVVLPPDVAVVGADELRAGRRAWIHEEVGTRRFRISAQSFFQSRPDGAVELVEAVRRAAGVELAGARVVDAYSGVGLLAAGLLDGAAGPSTVVAVERSAASVADARINLADLDVRIVRSGIERWRPTAAGVVVADPSRAGLGRRAADVLARTGAGVLVLVSCDAASLGRDAGLLGRHGFDLEQSELVDLFPHSHHVEVVTRFVR